MMSMHVMQQSWPQPLLQPDKQRDCLLYSVAYLCHCCGFMDVTPEQVRQYRTETGWMERSFPEKRLSVQAEYYWHYKQPADYQRFWLGLSQRVWVEQHFIDGQIALVCVHRVSEMGHIVVLLEADSSGVLLADPIAGHVRETWEWLLGIGPGMYGCHRVEGWYKYPASEGGLYGSISAF